MAFNAYFYIQNNHLSSFPNINLVLQGPIAVTDVREERALVSCGRPQDDGGSPVTGFMILDTGRRVICGQPGAQVSGLTDGRKYKSSQFKAVNTVDESETPTSSPSVPTTAGVEPTLKRTRDRDASDSVSSGGQDHLEARRRRPGPTPVLKSPAPRL